MSSKAIDKNKIPILICIDSFFDGGAEMFAIRLANNLPSEVRVYFFALRPWLTIKNKQKKLIDTKQVSIIELTGSFWTDLFFKLVFFLSEYSVFKKWRNWITNWRLTFVTKKFNIKIVNSHSWETDNAFSRVRKNAAFKLISTFHGHYELFEGSWAGYEKECKKLLETVDSVVYLSPQHLITLDKFQYDISKRTRIFHGLPVFVEKTVTKYNPSKENLRLVMAARGIAEKGWRCAIEAVIAVNNELGNKVTLDLIGSGEALDELHKEFKSYTYIHFGGFIDDILPLVKNSHIGLLPSNYKAESLPNCVIEYLMCGKPVIASQVGAIPEMILHKDEIAGVLLPLQNGIVDYQRLRDVILDYIRNPEKVEKDSAQALNAAKKFEMNYCINNYLQLFKSVLN